MNEGSTAPDADGDERGPVARPAGAAVLDLALVAAVLLAIAVAVSGVVRDPATLPEGAVALVNGQPITRADFEAVVARVAEQLGHAPGADERREVLARLVDEELLIQSGLALDLPRSEGRLRSMLVQEVMQQALAGVVTQPVSDADLAAFYARNAGFFRQGARLRARRFDFASTTEAEAMLAALRADGLAAALAAAEPRRSPLVPDALLPEARLRDYLGADLAARVAALQPGEGLLQPRGEAGASVVVLLESAAPGDAPLAAVHAEVEAEFRRRRDEQAVSDHLRRLREDARIVMPGAAP